MLALKSSRRFQVRVCKKCNAELGLIRKAKALAKALVSQTHSQADTDRLHNRVNDHARQHDKYKKEILPDLQKKFNRKNVLSIPRLEKITINMGVGKAIEDKNKLEVSQQQLTMIAGQKAVITKAKKAISAFRLREGLANGCKVTLRGRKMYEFLDRLINVALPRIRDFRGVNPKSFDGQGNYNLALPSRWFSRKSKLTKSILHPRHGHCIYHQCPPMMMKPANY